MHANSFSRRGFRGANGGTWSPVEWGANALSLPPEKSTALLHTKVAAIASEEAVHDLASSWCSALQDLRSRTTTPAASNDY